MHTNSDPKWQTALDYSRIQTPVNAIAVASDESDYMYAAIQGGRFFRSAQAGLNWEELGKTPANETINDLLVDSDDPNILYASANGRSYIYKSRDRAVKWTMINVPADKGVSTIAVSRAKGKPTILYAATKEGLIFWSMNQGETWENDPTLGTLGPITQIITRPDNPQALYVLASNTLYRLQLKDRRLIKQWAIFQAVIAVAVDPMSPRSLFASFVSGPIELVEDQGDTYSRQRIGNAEDFVPSNVRLSLAAGNHRPYFLYVGTDNGLFVWQPSLYLATMINPR